MNTGCMEHILLTHPMSKWQASGGIPSDPLEEEA